jgi:uroporphyrinogen decarboxylase
MNVRNDRFLRACHRQPVDATPIWIMRQAGRYLPEYRKLREQHDILTLCKTPELSAQVTRLPIQKFELDAAILFADIMLPLEGMGVSLEILENVGPVIEKPIRTRDDVKALRALEPEDDLPYVLEAIRLLRGELPVPLIGFAGAPFTLASYLIEGKPSRDFARVKHFMYSNPPGWRTLMELLTTVVLEYLKAQIRAGAQAVQLFDSWVGCLSPDDYREYVFPYSQRIFQELEKSGVPRIHFGVGTATVLELMREAGGDVIGVDWRIPLDQAWQRVGYDRAIQGNLDPSVLLGAPDLIQRRAQRILEQAGRRPGHIFNLGHGILPNTPPEHVQQLVDFVHEGFQ